MDTVDQKCIGQVGRSSSMASQKDGYEFMRPLVFVAITITFHHTDRKITLPLKNNGKYLSFQLSWGFRIEGFQSSAEPFQIRFIHTNKVLLNEENQTNDAQ